MKKSFNPFILLLVVFLGFAFTASAEEKAESLLANAKEQINIEKENAINDIRDIAIDLSIDIASKVIERNIDSEENRRLVEEAMNNIGES